MALEKAIVVATYPGDHAVDLVLVKTGRRMTGVQVSSGACSTRSGTVDLPAVPEKSDKWDLSQTTGQDIIALVDWIGLTPIVMGFLYPQINQMLFEDPKLRLSRHQSDVINFTDGDGNFGVLHPSGAYVLVSEAVDPPALASANTDKSLTVDRNTDKRVNVRVMLAGRAVDILLSADGNVSAKLTGDLLWDAGGDITLKAGGKITLQAGGNIESTAAGDNIVQGATVQVNP